MDNREQLPFEVLVQLGHALYARGRYLEAVETLDMALRARPGDHEVWNDRGIMLGTLSRRAEALESFNRAIALSPTYAEAHYNLGSAFSVLGKHAEALVSYNEAVANKPNFAIAWNNRGSELLALGRPDEALSSYDRAIELLPAYAEAHGNRAAALTSLARHPEALASADTAIDIQARTAEFHDHRGTALANMHKPGDALLSYDRAIALNPEFSGAYSNRSSVLLDLQRPAEALASCDWALSHNPHNAEACNNRGTILTELKRLDEALTSYKKATSLRSDYAAAWGNQGMLSLLAGRPTEGWVSWRRREQILWARTHHSDRKRWVCGEDLRGKTVFIEGVEGFGDAIQFCRRIVCLEAQGAKVTCAIPRPLIRLLKDISPTTQFVDVLAVSLEYDRYISLYNLAEGFAPSTTEAEATYLRAEANRAHRWKERLGARGFKIGICWQGSLADASRSFPPEVFQHLSGIPGVRLISLQKGPSEEEIARSLPELAVETLGDTFDAGPDAFLDTAAIMENLDLIIAPDTAIAHLAGALGRPVWVALKYVPDWRWGLDRCDTPWYPSMRLFRQQSYGDWDSAFAQLKVQLSGLTASR